MFLEDFFGHDALSKLWLKVVGMAHALSGGIEWQ